MKRVAVAVLGIPIAVGLVYLGGWPLAAALAMIAPLAGRELFLLGRAKDVEAFWWIGMTGTVVLVLLAGWTRSYATFAPWALTEILVVLVLSAAAAVWHRWPRGQPLLSVSLSVFGVLYTGGCLSFAIFLRHLPETSGWSGPSHPLQGLFLLCFPLAVTWMGDSAAYFFGTLLGKRKLIPAVSPGKTVAGGVAGLVTSFLTGAAVGGIVMGFYPEPLASTLAGGVFGLVLGFAIQIGDLVESVFKREAGVKDSGSIFPGHGGILDRFDALLFTLPVAYGLIRLLEVLR